MDKTELLKETDEKIKTTEKRYLNACKNMMFPVANKLHSDLKYLSALKNTLAGTVKQRHNTYIISTYVLSQIYDYLMESGEDENACYCTGVIHQNNHIPMSVIGFELEHQSAVRVTGSPISIYHALDKLDDFCHTILLQCHKHPGRGIECCYPSSLDLRNHKGLEEVYPVIGLIFVEDGYFRFFSAKRKFQVQIYGKGVKANDRYGYYFEKDD